MAVYIVKVINFEYGGQKMIHIDIAPWGLDQIIIDNDELFDIVMRDTWPLIRRLIQSLNKKLRIQGERDFQLIEQILRDKNPSIRIRLPIQVHQTESQVLPKQTGSESVLLGGR
jgi:hypothetical protein